MSQASSVPGPKIVIVGAGIVGATAAYVLRSRGARVVLVDRDAPGRGCSYGNAGAISPGAVAPLAMPGLLARTPRMLLDPEGPLHIPLGYLPRALPWLARFVAAARPDRVDAIAERLALLHAGAVDQHIALAREVGAGDLVERRGHLHVYPDEAALARDAAAWTLRARHGIRFARMGRADLVELEPRIAARYGVGVFLPDHAMVRNPLRYVQQIVRAFVVRGGMLARNEARALERDGGGDWSVRMADGRVDADHVIVAAGMHSVGLLEPIGVRLPLESQRGYHVNFRAVRSPVSRVVVLADRKAFVTPQEQGFRIAGTVEFGGLARPANPRRSAVLARAARDAFTGLGSAEESHWMGHRPCTPDSLPLIGPVPGRPGLWLATGHGHLGLTGAVATAHLLADAILAGSPASTPAIV